MRPSLLSSSCALLAVVGCQEEPRQTVAGPPLTLAPPAPAPAAPAPAPAAQLSPVEARFVDLTPRPEPLTVAPCTELLVAVIKGSASLPDDKLATGDVLAVRGPGGKAAPDVSLSGAGVVLVVTEHLSPCDAGGPGAHHAHVLGGHAPELTFMGGAMHAHLDVDDRAVAPSLYLGRLSGTASVPEHVHAGTWEILCAFEGAGTFTLAARPQRLGARTCVAVPPDTKHSWQPDPGSNLVAVQMYSPPGPEQRFKKLAGDEANR
jgi:mannose-6-phosphate isomerase-like protein (cupin superfamily)